MHVYSLKPSRGPGRNILSALLIACCYSSGSALGDMLVYSNLSTFTSELVQTPLPIWDDIQIEGGGRVTEISFRAFNTDTVAHPLSGIIDLRVYNTSLDSPPGLELGAVRFDFTEDFASGLTDRLVVDFSSEEADVAEDARLGLAITFDNDIWTNWAAPVFDPPDIGSSENSYWLGFNPVPIVGDGYNANMAWEIEVLPEPAMLSALFATMMLIAPRRRRRPR